MKIAQVAEVLEWKSEIVYRMEVRNRILYKMEVVGRRTEACSQSSFGLGTWAFCI